MANQLKTPLIKFKKGSLNETIDNIAGLIVFDDSIKSIFLEGKEYGPLSSYKPSAIIDENSTQKQLPTAKSVYNAINQIVENYFNKLNEELISIINESTTRVPAPEVQIDETSTDIINKIIKSNTVYIYKQPLNSFIIETIEKSPLETTIYFTVGVDNFEFLVPQGLKTVNNIYFKKNKSYIISIQNGIMIAEIIESYIENDNIIFNSNQLEGGYIDSPMIFENSDRNPIVNNVQPNAIYKFDICDSITLNNIPSNSLETIIYWTSDVNTILNLTGDSTTQLKITAGSETSFKNGSYVMVIKDGIIVISSVVEYNQEN